MSANLPDATVTETDGALGQLPADAGNVVAVVGASSSGTPLTVYAFTSPETVKSTLVAGPLAEAVAAILREGGGTVLACPATQTVAGTMGAWTQSGAGPVIASTGAPYDNYSIKVVITKAGAVGTSTFKYSLDGGTNYSGNIVTAATYAVPGTGITLTFTAGSYVLGDSATSAATAPGYSNTDLALAVDALIASSTAWSLLLDAGVPASAAAGATTAGSVASKMTDAKNSYRYARAIVQAASDTDANLDTAYSAVTSTRLRTVAGFDTMYSALYSGRLLTRPGAWAYAALLASIPISQDPSWVGAPQMPLGSVQSISRDERKTPGLDAARFVTFRTHVGRTGFYVTNGRTRAAADSDYQLEQYGRVMDRAMTVTRNAALPYVGSSLPTTDAGLIDPVTANAIEADILAQLAAAITTPAHASNVTVAVNRTDAIITTGILRIKIRLRPLGYAHDVEVEIGFENPALVAAAA